MERYNTKTEDGREIKRIYSYGYELILVQAKRRGAGYPQPNFLGNENFGLRGCRRVSTYKKNLLGLRR